MSFSLSFSLSFFFSFFCSEKYDSYEFLTIIMRTQYIFCINFDLTQILSIVD